METGEFKKLKKQYGKGVELRGKTLGIIGFGRIGQSLASYALGCGMKVIAIGKDAETVEIPVQIAGTTEVKVTIDVTTDLSAKLGEMDYISLHVPKQDDGSAVLDKAAFAKMKDGVRIVYSTYWGGNR